MSSSHLVFGLGKSKILSDMGFLVSFLDGSGIFYFFIFIGCRCLNVSFEL